MGVLASGWKSERSCIDGRKMIYGSAPLFFLSTSPRLRGGGKKIRHKRAGGPSAGGLKVEGPFFRAYGGLSNLAIDASTSVSTSSFAFCSPLNLVPLFSAQFIS